MMIIIRCAAFGYGHRLELCYSSTFARENVLDFIEDSHRKPQRGISRKADADVDALFVLQHNITLRGCVDAGRPGRVD